MKHLPAILIGGPSHSGKSALIYSLSQSLHQRGIAHYVIRFAADDERDWADAVDPNLVCKLSLKGALTPAFMDATCQSLDDRYLPLLVDIGGQPTTEQERIFSHCTHAILLTPDETAGAHWRALVARHHLRLIADFTSALTGASQLMSSGVILQGDLTGLECCHRTAGPTFEALVDCVAVLLSDEADELFYIHESLCPVELVINLQRLARTFDVLGDDQSAHWKPHHLPAILNYLPEVTPLALYGRGTNWIYAAVALLSTPAPFYQFDPHIGWVQSLSLCRGTVREQALKVQQYPLPGAVHLRCHIAGAHLDYTEMPNLTVPALPTDRGVVLSGKLPYWLYTSLACTYQQHPWIAVHQPDLDCAVIVHTTTPSHTIGDCIAV